MSALVDECVEAVLSSVKWLDQHKPGWASKIDLNKFEFILGDVCVAGQLGLLDKEIEQSQGFDSPIAADHEDLNFSYAHMDSLWRVFIQKRTRPRNSAGDRPKTNELVTLTHGRKEVVPSEPTAYRKAKP
jgi:hypothetical protein